MKIVDSRFNSLQQRRRALNPYNDTEKGFSCELGGGSIGACVLLLCFIGFSATASYLSTACSNFGDLGVSKAGSLRSSPPETNAKVGGEAASATKTAPQIAPPPAPKTETEMEPAPPPVPQSTASVEGLPPVCTNEQSAASLRQLPAAGCNLPPWKQSCSFTPATTRSCRDPYWMREFYATADIKTQFHAFFVGYAPNIEDYSDTPIDLLHVGTHNPKYVPQKQQWVELAGLPPTASCRRSVEGKGETKEAKVVLVLNPDQSDDPINHYKESLQISAEDLEAVADDPRIDDAFLASKLPNAESQIHYFRYLGVTPERFEAMKQMTRISSIWYLEFTLDWKSGLDSVKQQELLNQFLPEKGFVCYWAGNDNLWRITNCWQNHYSTSTWANVACVNARIPDAKPLVDKMEKIFVETLAKDITF